MTNDTLHGYTYDAEGNITKVDNGSTATYTYNALNQRVKTVANGATTEFVFNANGQRVSEWNASTHGELKGHYYWGSKPVAYYDTIGTHFQHQDWLGTERMRTSSNSSVEGTYTSFPWGDSEVPTGTDTDANHFATLDHDTESNTDHAEFRQYSNTQGRFLSPDPYDGSYDPTNPQSMNRYAYALNNPLSNIDPSGLCDWSSDWYAADEDGEGCLSGFGSGGGGGGGGGLFGYDSTSNNDGCSGHWVQINMIVWVDQIETECVPDPLNPGALQIGSGGGAPNNGPTPNSCQATLLNMANQQLGTNFNSSNVAGSYMNGTAYNIIIQSNQLTAGQFNNIQQGRYTTSGWQYLTGAGLAGHIADETNLGFAQSAFQSSNIGGNLSVSFAFHDDHGYANNPIGALIHWITDVLGHNTRKPC
jgi:RHS repeat-associated protein